MLNWIKRQIYIYISLWATHLIIILCSCCLSLSRSVLVVFPFRHIKKHQARIRATYTVYTYISQLIVIIIPTQQRVCICFASRVIAPLTTISRSAVYCRCGAGQRKINEEAAGLPYWMWVNLPSLIVNWSFMYFNAGQIHIYICGFCGLWARRIVMDMVRRWRCCGRLSRFPFVYDDNFFKYWKIKIVFIAIWTESVQSYQYSWKRVLNWNSIIFFISFHTGLWIYVWFKTLIKCIINSYGRQLYLFYSLYISFISDERLIYWK